MAELARVSFSLEQPLLERLEALRQEAGYANRSEFLRDLIRQRLVERTWERNEEVVGTITLLYDHHKRNLSEKLTSLQHDHPGLILATTHVHLDRHLCLEVVLVRGNAFEIRNIADTLRRHKGVLHSHLSMSSTGRELV